MWPALKPTSELYALPLSPKSHWKWAVSCEPVPYELLRPLTNKDWPTVSDLLIAVITGVGVAAEGLDGVVVGGVTTGGGVGVGNVAVVVSTFTLYSSVEPVSVPMLPSARSVPASPVTVSLPLPLSIRSLPLPPTT